MTVSSLIDNLFLINSSRLIAIDVITLWIIT
jgi:hypothetical protein